MRIRRLPRCLALGALVLWAAGLAAAQTAAEHSSPDIASAVPAWRFVTGGRVRFAPAMDGDGTILCASDDRKLYAVSPAGRERWRLDLSARPAAGPMVSREGTVYQGLSDGRILAVRPSGSVRWTIDLGGRLSANPAMDRTGILVVPLEAGELATVGYAGIGGWRFRFKAEIACPPVVEPSGLYLVATRDRLFHALTLDGRQAWTVALPGVGEGMALGGDGTIYVSAVGVHAFDSRGTPLWSHPLPGVTTAPVVAADGSVVVGCSDEVVYVLAADGSVEAELRTGAPVLGVAIAGELVYATTADGAMCVVDTASARGWRVSARDEVTVPAVRPGVGLAVTGSRDWVLYAWEPSGGQGPLERHVWDQWMGGPGRQGHLSAGPDALAPEQVILEEMARSELPSLKEDALERIERFLQGTEYLAAPAAGIESVLGFLALEGVVSPIYVGPARKVDLPRIRAESCRLLGELGSRGACRILAEVVEHDPAIEVQCAAVRALGVLGADPEGVAARAIAAALGGSTVGAWMTSCALDALASIASSGPLDPRGSGVLVRLARDGSGEIRRRALEALRAAARYAGGEGEW